MKAQVAKNKSQLLPSPIKHFHSRLYGGQPVPVRSILYNGRSHTNTKSRVSHSNDEHDHEAGQSAIQELRTPGFRSGSAENSSVFGNNSRSDDGIIYRTLTLSTSCSQNNELVHSRTIESFTSRRRLQSHTSSSPPTISPTTAPVSAPTLASTPPAQSLCPNGVKTLSVDFVKLHGATTSATTELASANRLYRNCCIRFVAGITPAQESLATTQSWLGGDTDLNASGITCRTPTVEERNMYDRATRAHSLSSRMRVFFVHTFSGFGTADGFSRPPYCSGGYANHVILSNSVSTTTNPLAHEFGHILLNSGVHATLPNLMAPTGGTVLSAADCATCYANA